MTPTLKEQRTRHERSVACQEIQRVGAMLAAVVLGLL